MVVDYLSRLIFDNGKVPIRDSFPDNQLFSIKTTSWFVDIVNFLTAREIP